MLRSCIAISWIGVATVATAEPIRMTDDAIRQQLTSSAVLEIDTPLGLTIPVRFSSNGIVSGEAGAMASMLGAAKDRGRWWTDRDQLCVKWFRWFDAKARCITLRRDGQRVYWQEASGESGTATIVENALVAAAPVAKPTSDRKIDVVATDMTTPPAMTTAEVSSPTLTDASPAADEMPSLRFAAASLSEAVSSPPPEADSPSKLGVGETTAEEPTPPPAFNAKPVSSSLPSTEKPARQPRQIPLRNQARAAKTQTWAEASFRVAGVNVGDTLNVRRGPSEFHVTVGSISPKARGVRIVGECRELWCPIRYGRVAGWVNRYYLAEDVAREAAQR